MGRRTLKDPAEGAAGGSVLTKDKIIEAIALEMSEGTWRPFRSVRELAARLNMTLASAQQYASEATRLLRLSWGQEEAKVAVIERIAQIGRLALEREEEALDADGCVHSLKKPDHRTALASAKHLADMLGLSGTNSEIVVRYQQMSDPELWLEAQRFAAQLQGKTHDGTDAIETSGEETSGEAVPEPAFPRDDGAGEADEAAALHRLDADAHKPRGR